MTLKLNFRSDLNRMTVMLADYAKNRLPKASADALNWTGFNAREAVWEAMDRVLDRPMQYTRGGVLVDKAQPRYLNMAVALRDRIDMKKKGLPASVYLRTQIDGGARGQKSHEKALSDAGVLPPGYYLVPTRYADLDAYGNMKAGQIVKILSSLNAFKEVGSTQNAWGRKGRGLRKGESYFAIVPGRPQGRRKDDLGGGGLPPGIYMVRNRALGLVLPVAAIVGSPPSYTPRLDFEGITRASIERDFPRLMAKAIDLALKQSK
ncbi:hypothetical protein [Falsiroseomonas tokyonensis]|uniref:Endolysin n=1 Tax=Falsiroseomonas tokyonensis TaxID=430521 RepID=A0ABV7BU24_9PROT|nr:hypothetical protein [Falsiroseomonas tokyonensis]MBU8538719.1 hypothetical protein [Falsiroseomonas tokyonensis]